MKLTDEQIDGLDGRELDAHVMAAVWGWRWLRFSGKGLCALMPPLAGDANGWEMAPCPESPEVERQMFEAVEGWPEPPERFDKWWRSCFKPIAEFGCLAQMPSPSRDIAAAWEVVERMKTVSPYPTWFELVWRPKGYVCNFVGDAPHQAFGETARLAICRAALMVMRETAQ